MRGAAQAPGPENASAVFARAAALRRFDLAVVRRLEGFLRGEHEGLRPGPGTDPADTRPYRPGEDDVRRMDWAATARTNEPHVREVVADRELETWVLVDLSPSMAFGTTTQDKRRLAVTATAVVGHLTTRLGDRFGAWVVDERGVGRRPARTGRLAVHAVLRELLDRVADDPAPLPQPARGGRRGLLGRRAGAVRGPAAVGASPEAGPGGPAGEDALGRALDALGTAHRRTGLRVVVSDFLDADPGSDPATARAAGSPPVGEGPFPWERPLRRLVARHQVLAVEVVDPREAVLPDVGVVALVDPETGAELEVDTGRAEVRAAFAETSETRRRRVAAALRACGAAHLRLSTDDDWVAETARFVLAHRRTARAVDRLAARARPGVTS